MTSAESVPVMPFERPSILEVPPLLMQLQAERPITLVRTPVGDPAWLVTRYADVKALLADRRFGRAHPDPDRAPLLTRSLVLGAPMSRPEAEVGEHTRMRRALTPSFMARRMSDLRPAIQEIVDREVDRFAALPVPADLHKEISIPVPALAICELFGVPHEDREQFRAWSTKAATLSAEESRAGFDAIVHYLPGLIARKREQPAEDVISDLIAFSEEDPAFSMREMITSAVAVLFAGHESMIPRIDFGALWLLASPVQRREFQEDPSVVRTAVEEILRISVAGFDVLPRYAMTDLELDGVSIRSGELVLVSRWAAHRDPEAFADAERFDLRREENQHLAFGHGHHFCIGAALARIELQTVLGTLFRRLPDLRLAVPMEELRLRDHLTSGGLEALPVAW